jgi:hypothetical protein
MVRLAPLPRIKRRLHFVRKETQEAIAGECIAIHTDDSLGCAPDYREWLLRAWSRHCWASMVNIRCSSAVRLMYPSAHAVQGDVSRVSTKYPRSSEGNNRR